MPHHNTLSPFVTVTDARALIQSYVDVLGAVPPTPPAPGPVAHIEVQIGDSVIALTELLPHGKYVLLVTNELNAIEERARCAGWSTTVPKPAQDGASRIMHATDPAQVTWVIQEFVTPACPE